VLGDPADEADAEGQKVSRTVRLTILHISIAFFREM
jgi:hypothetical protein